MRMLRPALSASLAEAEAIFAKQGTTRDVQAEALRIVPRRDKGEAETIFFL